MSIQESQLVGLRPFGYTEAEARFLYLVAVHSGYFTVRQFLNFAHAKSGKRNARFVEKLFRSGHATAQRYTRRSLIYHLCSRRIYEAIGKAHLRNRREHELDYIKAKLLGLDFILANLEDRYFETPEEKRRYLIERFKLSESVFSPSNGNGKAITFSEGFPVCVAFPAPDYMPVVTFTYVDIEHRNLDRYIRHLRTYRPLFRQLPSFQFIYISTAAGLQQEAQELFSFLVEGKGLSDLARYFDIETKWNSKKYSLVTENDLIFRNQVAKRFKGEIFDALFLLWRRNQLPKDLRADSGATKTPAQKVLFQAVTVPGQEAVFGDSRKRWGDGWQVHGASATASVPQSPPTRSQVPERRADT
ncbi:MAG TPA: hypothetical protein VJN21_03890 [Candidatus Acidoferrales bacterium]|nr:hypothetical protein [Candidatus Acidoferrales bacterium]